VLNVDETINQKFYGERNLVLYSRTLQNVVMKILRKELLMKNVKTATKPNKNSVKYLERKLGYLILKLLYQYREEIENLNQRY
jgi:hypothetical protein